jgi:hypothetical protein
LLRKRKDADPETMAAIAATAEQRLAEEVPDPQPAKPAEDTGDDDTVMDAPFGEAAILAAIQANQFAAVRAAVVRDSTLPPAIVRKILSSASAKAITALAWKARYSMTLAVALQTGPGGIAPDQVLMSRNGEYPLSESDMEWQLELSLTPADAVTRGARRASA